jgi:dolichyldiphosphatase
MDCPALKPLGLTYVQYARGDHIGLILSIITLFPILIPAQIVALLLVQRDWDTFVFLIGNLTNVALNGVLKRVIRESRPLRSCGAGVHSPFKAGSHEEFGMPSNHAQFMGFVAMFMMLYLQARSQRPTLEKTSTIVSAWCAAALCSYSRVYLGYHTTRQVVVGTGVGALFGLAWFLLYVYYLELLGRKVSALVLYICSNLRMQAECEVRQLNDKMLGLTWSSGMKHETIHAKVLTHNLADCQTESSVVHVVEVLRKQNPDVICLQEVNGTSLSSTIAHSIALKMRMFCVFVEATHGKCCGNAILSHWPIHSVKNLGLSPVSNKESNGSIISGDTERSMALAAVICPFRDLPDRDFVVICAHLGRSSDRRSSHETLDSYLKKQKYSQAIIAGEFHEEPGPPFIRDLKI